MLKGVCCLRLHTAGKFIGWSEFILSLVLYICVFWLMGGTKMVSDHQATTNMLDALTGCIYMAIISMHLINSIFLIIGVNKNRHGYLLPWLIWQAASLVWVILLRYDQLSSGQIQPAVSSIPYLALRIYIFYIILSLYQHIKTDKGLKEIDQEAQLVQK